MSCATLWQSRYSWIGVCCLALLAAGCGGSNVVEVSGIVTRGGKPLSDFAVTFQPEKGRPSMGQTDSNGRFELAYTLDEKGALRAKHKVSVRYAPIQNSYDKPAGAPADIKEIVEKYGTPETTQYEVVIDGPKKDLEIKLD